MTQIIISNGVTNITMPRTRKISDAGAPEYNEAKMAGGKIVRDVIGFRAGFKYAWDYVPATTIAALIAMLRTGTALTVSYFDVDGTETSGTFFVSYPTFELFTFRNGIPMWHNCSLTITSQEVR